MDGNGWHEPGGSADPGGEETAAPKSLGGHAPRARLSSHRAGAIFGGLTLLVVAALLATTVLVPVGPGPSPSPVALISPSPAAASSSPLATARPSGSPGTTPAPTTTPTPTPEPWVAASLPPFEPVAELAATRQEPGGTSVRTAFRLTSRSATPGVELAKGVEVTPPVQLAVSAGDSPATAILRPAAALQPGTTYRITVRGPDAALAGSWVFQTSSPPRVVGTLPANETTNVPVDTGIEVTFDQDGVGDIAPFFAISPKVTGSFERHGRTAVFVPADELKPLTVYTVTIRAGVPRQGSDHVLEDAEVFRFETAPQSGPAPTPKPDASIQATRDLVEVRTADAPVLELSAFWPGSGKAVGRVAVRVYRFPDLETAVEAYLAFRAAPYWADRTDAGLVRTAGLAEVARFSVAYHGWQDARSGGWIRFPEPLAAGWYLVDFPRRGRDAQVFLQVTDVHTTTIVGSGKALVWANDLATGGPLAGATVTTLDGEPLGSTDADGLMLASVPRRVLGADLDESPRAGVIVVRAADGLAGDALVAGRASFVPLAGWSAEVPFEDRFWRLLYTDRSLFRQVDTIEAWGLLRPRDGTVPPEAELRLVSARDGDDATGITAVARAAVAPDARSGVLTSSIPLEQVPIGSYTLGLWVGEHRVAATWVEVGVIRKPAYRLEVATDRRVVVAGEPLTVTATATFFDGTAAPGIEVEARIDRDEEAAAGGTGSTGGDGSASIAIAAQGYLSGQWDWTTVTVRPAEPEEAETSASTQVLAFRSSVVLDAEATSTAGRAVQVRGSLHAVDLARLEREQRAGFEGELQPQGAPMAGATITCEVSETWTVRIPQGRVYDFIAKKSVQTYEHEERTKELATRRVRTGPRGDFSLALPALPDGHNYEILLAAVDSAGRQTSLGLWAPEERSYATYEGSAGPSLDLELPAGQSEWDAAYAVGDLIRASIHAASGAVMPTGGRYRYLFYTARHGLLEARIQDEPTFARTFAAADVPSVTIGAAWFDGETGGLPAGMAWGCGGSLPFVEARIDPASRPVAVTLSADAARYRPGETVRLAVRTTDAAGRPVRATVVLRAIDEKLYAIGGAGEIDAPDDLYWWTASENGIAGQVTSHPLPVYRPSPRYTCGPGIGYREEVSTRSDFRDTLLFRRVTTDASGRASVSFRLSDDLTSWRISATAVSSRLEVGQATLGIPVGLPLFVEAPLAPDYLVGERPILRVRAYGEGLRAGDRVTFTVAAPSLGMAETRVEGAAFTAAEIPLPALRAGDHEIRIGASAGTGAAAVGDRLVRTIHVVETRFTRRATAYADLADGLPRPGGEGFVTYVFADAGRARYVEPLQSLAAGSGARVDQALAAVLARDLLVAAFDADADDLAVPDFDPERYLVRPSGDGSEYDGSPGLGIGLLPYSSADLALSARVALIAAGRFDVASLSEYFNAQRGAEGTTRERSNIALAGLAGLGTPVLDSIRTALDTPDLTIRERLYLALGAAALGDHATAASVERDLLAVHGQQMGSWMRLRVGDSLDDTIEASALLALIAATVGDPVGESAEAYVEANRATDDLFNLQQVGYISGVLDRTPAEKARVAYAVGGAEKAVDIDAGGALSLTLTPAQAAALTARTLAGRVGVAVSWDDPVDPTSLARDPSLTLTRTVQPAGTVPADRLVEVTLRATFGPQAVAGCYTLVDVLPSGLAPLGEPGQRIAYCLFPAKDRTDSVTYRARVVTPGTYRWEPAILQLAGAGESLALTPATEIEIR